MLRARSSPLAVLLLIGAPACAEPPPAVSPPPPQAATPPTTALSATPPTTALSATTPTIALSATTPTTTVAAPALACPEGMAAIPGGSYTLAARGDQAAVPPFCLDLTEVTIGAYKKCVDSGACTPPNAHGSTAPKRACNWNSPGRENHPVNCVDWSQASAYCASSGNRLPTEEEWEWAARSGNAGSTYPWGEAEPNETLANACGGECQRSSGQKAMYPGDDGFPGTAPVGSFPKGDSSSGVHDLAGNVWEWTQSLFNATDRVCRGGSWGDGAGSTSLKAQTRGWFSPSDRDPVLGFRCAK